MECDSSEKRDVCSGRGLRRLGRARGVRVGRRAGEPDATPAPPAGLVLASHNDAPTDPFMSDMDEISYWIHTKRAPCLMNYDNPIKKRTKVQEPSSVTEEVRSPKKKKKRKLSLLDDSASSEGQQNVFFESQKKTPREENDRKSDSLGSDIDFNVKNTSIQEKHKRVKLQKNNKTLHKKNKIFTSTPNTAVNLRRSLRHNKGVNQSHFNSSFEILNTSLINGAHTTNNVNQSALLAKDQTVDNKKTNIRNKSKNQAQNGEFDDVSDVSGFTANYIRSTKVQSKKTPRNSRCKANRTLVKESQSQEESNMVVCMNKSMNTGLPTSSNVLNCSTDSSQNLINLVTNKNNDKSGNVHKVHKVHKSTSILKFMETKGKCKDAGKVDGRRSKATLNISFQSQSSSTSRYPKRNKRTNVTPKTTATRSTDKRKTKNCIEFNNSDKKENPEENLVSKTRSGRNIGLSVLQRENSVLVVSNSTEPVSSMVSMNVASPNVADQRKKKRTPVRQVRNKKPTGKVQSPRRNSRDRSGFAACFSSDDDSEPLIHRKYFCH